MKGNTGRGHPVAAGRTAIIWAAVAALTALTVLRISVATGGAMNGKEAFLSVCAAHPAWGYVEGAAGTPLLLALFRALGVSGVAALRWIPPLAALPLSWAVWWIGRRVAPHRPAVALWSVLGLNLLPPVTLAALVMDGAMVTAALLLLTVVAGWNALLTQGAGAVKAWVLFGISLAVASLFWMPAGYLLPCAVAFRLVHHGAKGFPWRGVMAALGLLLSGWIAPVCWNVRHDWIGWSSVAAGFDAIAAGRHAIPLGLLVAFCAVITPFLTRLAHAGRGWAALLLLLGGVMSAGSGVALMVPSLIPGGLPSPVGVQGADAVADEVLRIRKERPDAKGRGCFLIASDPGLAALLGSRMALDYPERPGAPAVFAAESPSMNSSYALWPSYAEAVASGVTDALYTEEKSASPFLGRNALYLTRETRKELPQTITGAFGAVGLLEELPLDWNGHQVTLRVYQCEDYRGLPL